MHRQVGDLVVGDDGLARRGVLVRHLVMPGSLEDTAWIMQFLATDVSPATYVNIMDQYRPAWGVDQNHHCELNRRVTPVEMAEALRLARAAGLHRFDARR